MCWRTTCKTCEKPTYGGCGAHVEQVLGDVPPSLRCHCREERAAEKNRAPVAVAKKKWWVF
jgi:hypothetical protein